MRTWFRCAGGVGPLNYSRIGISIVAVSVIAIGIALSTKRRATARISAIDSNITSQNFNFGEARVGSLIHHVFKIPNDGPEEIPILRQEKSCSCTTVGNPIHKLAPHSVTELPVDMLVGREAMRYGSTVVLVRGDGRASIALTLECTAIRDVPEVIDFGTVTRGQSIERHFVIKPVRGRGGAALSIQADQRLLSAKSEPSGGNSADTLVTISLAKDVKSGPFETNVIINTDDTEAPGRSVLVKGNVAWPIEVDPQEIVVSGRVDGTWTYVKVFSPEHRAFRITELSCDPKRVVIFQQTMREESSADLSSRKDTNDVLVGIRPGPGVEDEWTAAKLSIRAEINGEDIIRSFDLLIHLSKSNGNDQPR